MGYVIRLNFIYENQYIILYLEQNAKRAERSERRNFKTHPEKFELKKKEVYVEIGVALTK